MYLVTSGRTFDRWCLPIDFETVEVTPPSVSLLTEYTRSGDDQRTDEVVLFINSPVRVEGGGMRGTG